MSIDVRETKLCDAPKGYIAVEVLGYGCRGCAFDNVLECQRPVGSPSCTAQFRSDGRNVQFKEVL